MSRPPNTGDNSKKFNTTIRYMTVSKTITLGPRKPARIRSLKRSIDPNVLRRISSAWQWLLRFWQTLFCSARERAQTRRKRVTLTCNTGGRSPKLGITHRSTSWRKVTVTRWSFLEEECTKYSSTISYALTLSKWTKNIFQKRYDLINTITKAIFEMDYNDTQY